MGLQPEAQWVSSASNSLKKLITYGDTGMDTLKDIKCTTYLSLKGIFLTSKMPECVGLDSITVNS